MKLAKPYYNKLIEFRNKFENEYSESDTLKRLIMYFTELHDISYVTASVRQINLLLGYTDLDNELRKFLEEYKSVLSQIDEMLHNGARGDTGNRRMSIYKRFMSQYLGPEWQITQKRSDKIEAKKIK